jgi:membrane protease YdiL (CAAX protease family)
MQSVIGMAHKRYTWIALPYFAAYLVYLFLHSESELFHWATLVAVPLVLVLLLQGGRPRSFSTTPASFGLKRVRLGHGVVLAVALSLAACAFQLSASRYSDDIWAIIRSGQVFYLLPLAFLLLMLTAGFTEEFFFRGFLQTRLELLLGSKWLALVAASLCFGLYHLPYAYLNPNWPSAGDGGSSLMRSVGAIELSSDQGIRGTRTYWEGRAPRALTGGDLVAAQHAAYEAYARLLRLRDDAGAADYFEGRADSLRAWYNRDWWDRDPERFYTSVIEGEEFETTFIPLLQILPLYFGIVDSGPRRERFIDNLQAGSLVEVNIYLAEAYYRHGRHEEGFRRLMTQMDPNLERREYPENPFTAVGTIVRSLMGVDPKASSKVVETVPRLPKDVSWVRVEHVPILANEISVCHEGLTETQIENESGATIQWRAVLPSAYDVLVVDGRSTESTVRYTEGGSPESYVELEVGVGEKKTVGIIEL